jgi:hypothetical protein
MKRVVVLFLMVTYSLSCIGLGVNRFFCCGKLASVTLQYGAFENTDVNKSKKESCCKHEKTSFKIKDAHFNTPLEQLKEINQPCLNPLNYFNFLANEIASSTPLAVYPKHPSGLPSPPIYKLNCTYLI